MVLGVVWHAVIFDLYQTLVRGGTAAQRRDVNGDMARALGLDRAAFADLFNVMTAQRMRGEFGGLEGTVRTLARRLGGEPTDAQVRLAVLTWQRFHKTVIWPSHATLSTLDSLRERGLKLGLMSNCSEETPIQWPAQPMAQRFDAVVFSCDIGTIKPDPAIYQAVLSRLHADPRACVYVGDGNDNELGAARALGMRAIRTLEYTDSDPQWAGESVAKLAEVIDRLGQSPTSGPSARPGPRAG
jgi:putative hydrolase of the HAD superfamily